MLVDIPVADETIEGYLALPLPAVSGDGPWPGVVVVHDVMGLSDDVRAIAERFATAGFLALVPNLFARGGALRCVRAVFRALADGEGQAFDDIDGAHSCLAGRPDCTGKVGVAGFCMGGGFALLATTRGFEASAPYYGHLPRDLSALDGACPVVASFGAQDPTLRGAAATLTQALTERGIEHDVKEYPSAGHSFANRIPLSRLLRVVGFGYHHESSEDAWRRVLAFFTTHLAPT